MRLSGQFLARLAGAALVAVCVLLAREDPMAVTMLSLIAAGVLVFLINLEILRRQGPGSRDRDGRR